MSDKFYMKDDLTLVEKFDKDNVFHVLSYQDIVSTSND